MTKHRLLRILGAVGVLLSSASEVRAQWSTQSFDLTAGWNAIYLHVDASHLTLDDMVGSDPSNPIREIWLWQPAAATAQFIVSPQQPIATGTQWASWVRLSGASTLQRLVGNGACLVKLDAGAAPYTWNIKGKVVAPVYQWTTTGLNFIGFPTVLSTPPSFEAFLAKAPELQLNAEIFRYVGGDLGPGNPARLYALNTTPVRRGEAMWIRSGDLYNKYYGPFEVVLQSAAGVKFGDSTSQYELRLRNQSSATMTVTALLAPSESAPAGQPAVAQTPPLLLRGTMNPTNLTYGFARFADGPQQWTLQPKGKVGSEVNVVLGINRSQMVGNPGDIHAAILRFTDSLGFCQVDVPVSATVASSAGLWVGSAAVDQVRHYLKSYAQQSDGRLITVNGAYVSVSTNTSLGGVARPFPLRLILHRDTRGGVVLLQRVYCGAGLDTNLVVATRESLLLNTQLASARRITAVHLPWNAANNPWPCVGQLQLGATLATTVDLAYDDQASNPFLHTYHPDHDSLDATFSQPLSQGEESYGVSRHIALTFTAPGGDFASVTAGSQTLGGTYDERVVMNGKTTPSGPNARQFEVRGTFVLNRISAISTLTRP
jgi:hypothetical protein